MLIFSLFPWNFSDGWHFTWCYTCWKKPVVFILKQFYKIIFGVTLQSISDNTVGDWLNGNKRSHANCPKQGKSLWSSCCRAPEISSSSTSSIIDCHASHVIGVLDNHLSVNFGRMLTSLLLCHQTFQGYYHKYLLSVCDVYFCERSGDWVWISQTGFTSNQTLWHTTYTVPRGALF